MTEEQASNSMDQPTETPSMSEDVLESLNEQPPSHNNDEQDEEDIEPGEACGLLCKAMALLAAPVVDEAGGGKSVSAGLFSLFLIGTSIGLSMPKNTDLPTHWYRIVSACVGWIYFLCWSVSFYPQVISNYKRKTTQGLSADFCGLNVLGFACYSIYNVAFYWSGTIRKLYKERHGDNAEITVQSNDVAFALHALILSTITFVQIGYYDGIRAQKPSKPILASLLTFLCVCTFYPWLVIFSGGKSVLNWLNYLYILSTIKVLISLIKYVPQDFTGGLLSDIQLIFDCKDLHDFSAITGNFAKFGLGSISIFFDIIFMLQHYVLYAGSEAINEQQPLLADEEGEDSRQGGNEEPELASFSRYSKCSKVTIAESWYDSSSALNTEPRVLCGCFPSDNSHALDWKYSG
eukprot:scaffold22753_cov160-Cylindrotheca_fusiformis.AAC.2